MATPLRQLKLTNSAEIRAVFRSGKRVNDPHMRIIFRRTDRDHPRFCIQVSRKISKKAVVRNRIRRRAREAFRELLDQTTMGFDIVILAQRSVATMPWNDLTARSRNMVQRITSA